VTSCIQVAALPQATQLSVCHQGMANKEDSANLTSNDSAQYQDILNLKKSRTTSAISVDSTETEYLCSVSVNLRWYINCIDKITAKTALKFGSEAWVLKKRDEKHLEAAQMKFFRHLLGITKLDKEKNQSINP
jgi:restriction endonuclease Mrr